MQPPMPRTTVARLRQVARAQPDAPALVSPGGAIVSFAALWTRVEALAGGLADAGIGPRDVVALALPKGLDAVAMIFAVQHRGAIPCQLDPASPAQRLQRILDRCQPRIVVVPVEHDLPLGEHAAKACPPATGAPRPPAAATGTDPAYIMFTSGSTGFPKGAVIAHGAVLRLAIWARETYGLGPGDRLTHVNPLYFDNAVFDVYCGLLNGAALVPLPQDLARRGRDLLLAVRDTGCTFWFSVPTLLIYLGRLRAFPAGGLPALRQIAFGGEGFPLQELQRLRDSVGPDTVLWNVYGPTECTCICSANRVTPQMLAVGHGFAPLGQLAADFAGVLLDEHGAELAGAATGELALLGPQVGLGYYDDAERTARAFPLRAGNPAWPERMYRTGDLVSRDADGTLRFVGRADNQIKHMGYRIELEEIDAAINALPEVAAGVSVYLKGDAAFGRLEAMACLHQGVGEVDLLAALKAVLPAYMVPSRVHVVPDLPRNANGKVDRRAAGRALS